MNKPSVAFFDRLRTERPMWRLNWTVLDNPALHLPNPGDRQTDRRDTRTDPGYTLADPGGRPTDPGGRQPDGATLGGSLWFRVERQTFRRLPHSGAVVFTIRTYICSLGELVATYPAAVPALEATLRTVPAATVRYKGWSRLLTPLVDWLAAQPAQP